MLVGRAKSVKALLDWETVCVKLPWGPVFLLGGGYALADAFEVGILTYSVQIFKIAYVSKLKLKLSYYSEA